MGIEQFIEENYDIKVSSYINYRDGFLINTPEQTKYLFKPISISEERLAFIDGLKYHLYKNGFTRGEKTIVSRRKEPFVVYENMNYVLSEFIHGRECDFYDRNDIAQGICLLADFHRAAKGFIPTENAYMHCYLGLTPKWYTKKIKELKRVKSRASMRKTKFDSLLMEHIDYFIARSENALSLLKQSPYGELVKKANIFLPVCHNDFSYYSILCTDQGLFLLNFDSCRYDLCIFDIADFIIRRMRKCNWDIEEAKRILLLYHQRTPLSRDELAVLKIIIRFPERFSKTVNRYYNSKKSKAKSGYLSKLQELIDEIPQFEAFMVSFDGL